MGDQLTIGSLCSGAGGLDMAVEQVFGAETVWHSEMPTLTDKKTGRTRRNAAVDVLAHRWPGVPNHGDLITTDWSSVEPVDIMCAGWPCQPFSPAGKRKGAKDERAIWPYVARAIRVVRPRIVVLENVPAVLGPEFQRVADSLAALGYDIRWTCLRASDVGAPHRRERLFIVAISTVNGWALVDDSPGSTSARSRWEREPGRSSVIMSSDGRIVAPGHNQRGDETCLSGALLPTPAASDSHRGPDLARAGRAGSGGDDLHTFVYKVDRDRKWGKYAAAIQRWETITRPAPSPTEPNTKGNPRLNPAFSEWMQGWPLGWVTELVTLGIISRNDALRIIGNGVVPQCAAAALRWLLSLDIPIHQQHLLEAHSGA